MQKEIITPGPLLDKDGNLVERGFSRKMLKEYNRSDVKVNSLKIKEWDYYLIYDDNYAIALTLDDNSYMGLISVSVIDFKNKKEKTVSPMKFFTLGKRNLPSSSKTGDVTYEDKQVLMNFKHQENGRVLKCVMKNFHDNKDFECLLSLEDEPEESLVIATPFNKKKHFYYNQKIVGFKVCGYFKIGDYQYTYNKDNTIAILDWGRGVWTYKNVWYWGAGAKVVNNHMVGFNIGYGFGDTSAASENSIFYDGKLHKINNVTFNIPKDEKDHFLYEEPWTFTSDDGRFEMDFTPIIDRKSKTDALILCSDQHQIFGKFNGTLILDDGTEIKIKDFIGFAERVLNKW